MEKHGSNNRHNIYQSSFLYKLAGFINGLCFGSSDSKSQGTESGSDILGNLPEDLIFEIMRRLTNASNRDSLFYVSKKLYQIKADQKRSIRIGCGLKPLTEAYLTSLFTRYPNLTKIKITYTRLSCHTGKQLLDDQGLFILSTNCPSLTSLTLKYCFFITDSGLTHLASCEKLVHLSIVKCCSINEHSLVKLGNCLRRLERFEFQNDWHWLVGESCFRQQVCCESLKLKELHLVNCSIVLGNDLYLILRSCSSLEKICLETCNALEDRDIISLSEKWSGLKSISLNVRRGLTDASFIALGTNCKFLESFELSFPNSALMDPLVTLDGILAITNGCSIRTLVFKCVPFLDDFAMEALSSVPCLNTLEIEMAKLTNLGIGFVVNFPRLVNRKISNCYKITDDGLIPLIVSKKLNYLMIRNCCHISKMGAKRAAMHVCYQ